MARARPPRGDATDQSGSLGNVGAPPGEQNPDEPPAHPTDQGNPDETKDPDPGDAPMPDARPPTHTADGRPIPLNSDGTPITDQVLPFNHPQTLMMHQLRNMLNQLGFDPDVAVAIQKDH